MQLSYIKTKFLSNLNYDEINCAQGMEHYYAFAFS